MWDGTASSALAPPRSGALDTSPDTRRPEPVGTVGVVTGTVFVVDDDVHVRDSLSWLIASAGLAVETFPTAERAYDRVRGLYRCERDATASLGCLVADLRMPGLSGLELHEHLHDAGVQIPTLIITGHGDVATAVRAVRCGCLDFIEKPFSDQMLLDRIHDALRQDARQVRERLRHTVLQRRMARLSEREMQVLKLVVAGHLNKEIANKLGLSHKTIEVHRSHVMAKMQASSFADLVRMAADLGM